mmetsp:Transcript_13528/g.40564  ORF Transcript_13528/g.40564 Transcript_13528/m.40564 type:complete len:210 (+) Transcript_13528:729-1358(+)
MVYPQRQPHSPSAVCTPSTRVLDANWNAPTALCLGPGAVLHVSRTPSAYAATNLSSLTMQQVTTSGGAAVGAAVGDVVGANVGAAVGVSVGVSVGRATGDKVGVSVGPADGATVGLGVTSSATEAVGRTKCMLIAAVAAVEVHAPTGPVRVNDAPAAAVRTGLTAVHREPSSSRPKVTVVPTRVIPEMQPSLATRLDEGFVRPLPGEAW